MDWLFAIYQVVEAALAIAILCVVFIYRRDIVARPLFWEVVAVLFFVIAVLVAGVVLGFWVVQ